MRIIKRLLFAVVIVWVLIVVGGRAFDQVCIEGRLSEEQSKIINVWEWDKCPKYNQPECRAEAGDRVLRRECSEFSRALFFQGKLDLDWLYSNPLYKEHIWPGENN